jgi:hypothetical protein
MSPQATLTPSAPLIQGVASPNVVVNPDGFYAATRRMRFPMRALTTIAGLGSSDSTQLRQTGIIALLEVRVTGTITFAGTITGTSMSYEWPFNLIRNIKLSANGQSNLVNMRGLTVRALEYLTNPKIDDTGLTGTFGSTAVTNGTLKMPMDDWGTSGVNSLNPGATVAATGAYTVDLTYFVPVAADPVSLVGAVYAQSAATNLSLDIDWQTAAALYTLGGSATATNALQYSVTGRAYSIPNVNGQYLVPDLSQFHQLAEFRQGGIAQGVNEILLPGTGVGRKLLRIGFNAYSGATPAPIALNATNYTTVGWAYGGNDQPETYPNGQLLRAENYRISGCDMGANWGLGWWDFASQFALRDVIDEGSTSDLRLLLGLVSAPTSGYAQILQETLFAAPVGA